MTQFYEGQEVEVAELGGLKTHVIWREAKILCEYPNSLAWLVEYPDGVGAVVDTARIRAIIVGHASEG